MTPPTDPAALAERRRTLVTCLWLALAVLAGGLDFPLYGYAAFRFAPFGVVAGLLGIVWLFALVAGGAVVLPHGWLRVLAVAYWAAATAMVFRVLLPPPSLVQAVLAVVAAVGAGIAAMGRSRERAALWAGITAVGLAALRFAVVPAFWSRSELPNWGPLQLGATADAVRDFVVAYAPERPAAQAVHFAALACWAAALWVQWRSRPAGPAAGHPGDPAGHPFVSSEGTSPPDEG